MIGASAAMSISGLPFAGPMGAARVGYIDGNYVLNPTTEQMERFAAGPDCVRHRKCRVDGRVGSERTPGRRHAGFRGLRARTAAGGHQDDQRTGRRGQHAAMEWTAAAGKYRAAGSRCRCRLRQIIGAYKIADKLERYGALNAIRAAAGRQLADEAKRLPVPTRCKAAIGKLEKKLVRSRISPVSPYRRPRHRDGAPDHYPYRCTAACPWLRTVHPRRDAGAGCDHARHRA